MSSFAQEFKSDEERLKYANDLFEEGKFEEAAPHMLHFLSLNQTSGEFNFKYGVCLLKTDEDKSKSIRYLRYASKQGGVDSRVYFYLGEAYHLNYLFNDAIVEYQKYKSKGDPKLAKKYDVDLRITMCSNGKKLMKHLTELVVSDKKESSYDRFQYSYDLSQMGGKILVSEEFQSKYDKKVGYRSLVYFPPLNQDVIFYSSYGKDGATGLDIYQVKRLPNGGWSEPLRLPDHINTPYDDAFAYLHPDGSTFYFCSQGHTSMGGYDVFKCSYDINSNTFGPPVNQDYKINTPDDDIMYVVDSLNENAYFASARAAKGGYLDVYKVRVEVFPLMNVILAGTFINEIDAADINATIKVENTLTGVTEGIYNPNKEGDYVIVLPKSGRYKLIVETPNSEKIHSGIVEIPPQKELRPLKQEILLVNKNGEEQLVIRNLFDQDVENAADILAQVMKQLADPDVNADEFPDSLFNVNHNAVIDSVLSDDGSNLTKEDLISMSNEMADEAEDEAKAIEKRMNAAYTVANNKSKAAVEAAQKAQDILKNIDAINNPLEKQQQIELANEYHKKSKDLNQQATTSLNLANKLEEEYNLKTQEVAESRKIAIDIENALNENSHDKAVAELQKLKGIIEKIIRTDSSDIQKHTAFDKIVKEAIDKQADADKALADAQNYRNEQDQINIRLKNLRNQYDIAKDKDKPDIQTQITLLEEEYAAAEEIAKESFAKNATLQKEADELQHQADLLSNIFEEMENNDDVNLTAEEKAAIESLVESSEVTNEISSNEDLLANLPVDEKTTSSSEATSTSEETTSSESVTESEETNESESTELTETTESSSESETEESTEKLTADNWYSGDEYKSFEEEVKSFDENLTPEEKAQKENEIYEQWIKKLDEDIQDATNKALNTQESSEKRKYENRVVALMQLKDEKEYLMNQNNELLQESGIASNEETNYEKFENQLTEKESITDEVEKAKQENQVAKDWVDILDEDIQNAKDKLTLEDDPTKRSELENQIEKLEKLKSEKENLIAQNEEIIAKSSETTETEETSSTELESSEETTETESTEVAESTETTESESSNQSQEAINKLTSEISSSDEKIARLNEEFIAASDISDPNQRQIKQQEINESLISELKDKAQKQKELMDLQEDDEQKSETLLAIKNTFNAIQQQEEKANEWSQLTAKSSENSETETIEIEARNLAASTEDVEHSLTNTSSYQHAESNEEYENISENVDELNVLEQEVAALKMNYEAETKEKKKEKISEQIENKEIEKYVKEVEVAEGIGKANANEKQKNQEDIDQLKSQLKANDSNISNEKNYITASTLEKVANEQFEAASKLRNKASNSKDLEEKAELSKEATALEKAALTNQNEAADILEEISNATYVADYIENENSNQKSASLTTTEESTTTESTELAETTESTTATETEEATTTEETTSSESSTTEESTTTESTELAETTESTTATETEEATTTEETTSSESSTTEESTTTESTELAETTESTTETETEEATTTEDTTTEESTMETEMTSNFEKSTTPTVKDVVESETVSGIEFDPTQKNVEVYTPTTTTQNKNVSELEFTSESANTTKSEHQEEFNEIASIENEIQTISKSAEFETSEKEQIKTEKEINKLEKKKAKKEVALAEVIEQSNKVENEIADAGVTTFTENSTEIEESSNYKQAEEFISAANKLQSEATELRKEAEDEKDKVEKSNLLKEAANKEQKAVSYKNEAKKMMASAIVETYNTEVENLNSVNNNELSNNLKTKSEEANERSMEYAEKATLLRDSASTINKTEEKSAVIAEAEKLEEKANVEQILAQTYEEQSEAALIKETEIKENEELLSKINSTNSKEIRKEDQYVQFYKKQKEIDSLNTLVKIEEAKQEGFENLSNQQEAKAKSLINQAEETEDKEEKESLLTQAEELNTAAQENRKKKAMSAATVEDLYTKVESKQTQQDNVIASLSSEKQDLYKALALSNLDQEPIKKVELGNIAATNFKPPTTLDSDIIQFNQTQSYSDANPIPVNPGYPDGLVYMVQVGAFRKPIPQDLFKGFAPITADKINDDITRYRVGYFTNFNIANEAKNEIRPLGYPDAFVVAIYNGKRISIAEARQLENGNASTLASVTTNSNPITPTTTLENGSQPNNTSINTTTSNNQRNTSGVPEYVANMGEDAAAVEAVEVIEGCFYTVQIGAFSKPIKTTDVFNVSPLVTKYVNGLYKYSTGVFGNIEDANARKQEMVNRGLTDAFVTAYCDGEKKSVQELTNMIASQGSSILAVDNSGNIKHKNEQGGSSNPANISTTTEDVNMITSKPTNVGTEYFVDLGTYSGSVPQGIGTALLLMYDYEIITTKLNDNTSNYSCGAFTSKDDAERAVQKFQLLGIENAKVVEHIDGKTIENDSSLPPTPVNGLVYRVFLGTYANGSVPLARSRVFLELDYLGIESTRESNGDTYYCGKEGLYSEAQTILKEFMNKGVSIAKIVAFKDGTQIDVDEARKLTHEE